MADINIVYYYKQLINIKTEEKNNIENEIKLLNEKIINIKKEIETFNELIIKFQMIESVKMKTPNSDGKKKRRSHKKRSRSKHRSR